MRFKQLRAVTRTVNANIFTFADIVLHPFETINNPFIDKITDSFAQNFKKPTIRQSAEFEKVLFNQKDHIEKNSYVSGHDTVNVFGKSEMTYFIKANEGAIDIQLGREV